MTTEDTPSGELVRVFVDSSPLLCNKSQEGGIGTGNDSISLSRTRPGHEDVDLTDEMLRKCSRLPRDFPWDFRSLIGIGKSNRAAGDNGEIR